MRAAISLILILAIMGGIAVLCLSVPEETQSAAESETDIPVLI